MTCARLSANRLTRTELWLTVLPLLLAPSAALAAGHRAAHKDSQHSVKLTTFPQSEPAPSPAQTAPGGAQVGVAEPIYDPSGKALAAWNSAVLRAKSHKGQARAAFYGASHTAADLWTGELRRMWQTELGEAGHGFMLPSKWNLGYRQQDLVVDASPGWQILRHKREMGAAIGEYGLLGVAMQSANPNDFAEIRTTHDNPIGRKFDQLEVWLQPQVGGGSLRVVIDGHETVLQTSEKAEPYATFKLADTPHVVRLQPLGDGPVLLYGVVAERSAPGIILDQLGIPGMRAEILLHWTEARWAEQLRRRNPDLVVLAYGTNDVTEDAETIDHYLADWRKVIAMVKRAAPNAACLIVGPTDRLVGKGKDRKSAPRTPQIVAAQRQIANETGCAHWDPQRAMGGPNAMLLWQDLGLAQPDGVHLNRAGYKRMAELFAAALADPRAPP